MDGSHLEFSAVSDLFIIYQMGSSEDYTWYSVVAVFLSERDLRDYAATKSIGDELGLREPDQNGDVLLAEPAEFVAVRTKEGEVPDVELEETSSSARQS